MSATDNPLREEIAREMFLSSYPEQLRPRAENGEVIVSDIGGNWTSELDTDLDWYLNADSYRKLADIALAKVALRGSP